MAPSRWRNSAWSCDHWDSDRLVSERSQSRRLKKEKKKGKRENRNIRCTTHVAHVYQGRHDLARSHELTKS